MPSVHRHKAVPTVVHPAKEIRPRRNSVNFPAVPVTGVSRPVNAAENWAAANFEAHARRCAFCHDPYEVHRAHGRLCEAGHRLAQEVACYVYRAADGFTYSTKEEDTKPVRVEIPANFDEVRGLLRAMQRSLRSRRYEPFVSMDRSYYITPRRNVDSSPRTVKLNQQPQPVKAVKPAAASRRPVSGEIVDWPSTRPFAERRASVNDANPAKRRSLYSVDDLAKPRRDSVRYNVEVRAPAWREGRDDRRSGYYR